MNIHGIGPTAILSHAPAARSAQESHATTNNIEPNVVDSDTESQKASGVIRNLQEGHYRGVADVRLRINFHEQLASIKREQSAAVVEDAISQLESTVQSEIESLLASGQLSEEQAVAVSNTFDAVQSSLAAIDTGQLDSQAAIDSMIQAGDTFFESLAGLIDNAAAVDVESGEITASETAESVDEPAAVIEEGVDPTAIEPPEFSAIEEFVNQLSTTYNDQLEALRDLLQATSLPELSPPDGNGVAYAKFLAVYQELHATEASNDDAVEKSVDTTV